ncbi:hypothetical protein NDU88_007007 [Pleurodeles waltl]|uniref:Uncharacterized protein n=1 Tax=Pleurodeles waltl TaxID=8319 RepID=A0AAV7U1R6_PLEWA|nr:hypothetical protein NDU88_007007 [Pleurodeles waltl]
MAWAREPAARCRPCRNLPDRPQLQLASNQNFSLRPDVCMERPIRKKWRKKAQKRKECFWILPNSVQKIQNHSMKMANTFMMGRWVS